MKKQQLLAFSFGLILLSSLPLPVRAEATDDADFETMPVCSMKDANGNSIIRTRILINASPMTVWFAIRDNRNDDPDVQYSKITQLTESKRLLEQKYVSLPMFGATTCTLMVEESFGKRIDYKLLKSDRLAEFDGSWVLTPARDNKATIVELTNHIKLKFPVPQKLVDSFASKKLKMRAAFVKNRAEADQLQIASNN